MNQRPLYIFDLDGTLALIEHRRHFVERPACPHCGWVKACDHDKTIAERRPLPVTAPIGDQRMRPKFKADWDSFHAACVNDKPNPSIISIMRSLQQAGAETWIFSGRSDAVHQQTRDWLTKHEVSCTWGQMRPAGDFTPDDVLKRSWYDAMLDEDKARLVATFDDRDRVVAMWRSLGVACFQVAPGDF